MRRIVGLGTLGDVIPYEEMPEDNADLAHLTVSFERLEHDSAESCPVPPAQIFEYLSMEVPGGEHLRANDLVFLRTAHVADRRYWIWRFEEPDGRDPAYVTVAIDAHRAATIGYDTDYYGLSPEQFMLGDYYGVF